MVDDDENACVRNIAKEIMRECAPRKIKVNKNFVTYVTKLLLMNPNWGIGDDFFNQRENVQHFVKYVIEQLLSKENDPRIVSLKIQFHFACNLEHMDYVIEMNRRDLKNRLIPLREKICSTREQTTDIFVKRIVYYITLATGLGDPSNPKVYEEALVALKSILDEDELLELYDLPKHEKQHRLTQLSQIVAGIRLFNKHCEKGGEGIADLPDLLNTASDIIREGTEVALLQIMEKVNSLTTLVDKWHVIYKTPMGCKIKYAPPKEVQKANINIEYVKDLLIFFRQYELLIRRILEYMEKNRDKAAMIYYNMQKMFKTIHNTVYMKLAIPVGVVFPLFEQLWTIWEQFQNQVLLLSRLSVIIGNLEDYSKQLHYDHIIVENLIGNHSSMTDAERLSKTAHFALSSSNVYISVIRSEHIKNMSNIKLEYLGFCVWKLKETDGALIPGNPSMGIIVYKQKNYVFSCPEAFGEFAKDPQMYINYVLDLTRKKPQLIDFFQLKEELESVYSIVKLVESNIDIKVCDDKSVQTMANTEETHIDHNYKWNIWDLKKNALTMAKLCNDVTTTTQTDKTNSKNSIRCQTYYTKTLAVDTTRDAHTNVPKPSVFLYGLRGRTDDQQFKVELTRPVEE